jgi:hypothetical protein
MSELYQDAPALPIVHLYTDKGTHVVVILSQKMTSQESVVDPHKKKAPPIKNTVKPATSRANRSSSPEFTKKMESTKNKIEPTKKDALPQNNADDFLQIV